WDCEREAPVVSFRDHLVFPCFGVCVAMERICAAAHICSYVEFRNMWSLWPGRPVILYDRAHLPRIFLAASSIVKGVQSIHLSANLRQKLHFRGNAPSFPVAHGFEICGVFCLESLFISNC